MINIRPHWASQQKKRKIKHAIEYKELFSAGSIVKVIFSTLILVFLTIGFIEVSHAQNTKPTGMFTSYKIDIEYKGLNDIMFHKAKSFKLKGNIYEIVIDKTTTLLEPANNTEIRLVTKAIK